MSSEKRQIHPTEAPVTQALLMVCEKCGKSDSRRLFSDLKRLVKDRGLKGEYRVALTSCLDICPKRGIALAIAGVSRPAEFVVCAGDAAIVLEHVTGKRQN